MKDSSMPPKKIMYKGATYTLAESYHDKPVTIELHVSCKKGDPQSGDCMYTAKIVDAAPMIEGDDTESSIKMLEAYCHSY